MTHHAFHPIAHSPSPFTQVTPPHRSSLYSPCERLQALFDVIIYNATARISYDKPDQLGVRQDTGSKTECALLEVAHDFGRDREKIIPADFSYVAMHTFSSARKRMSCVIKKDAGCEFIHTSPEYLQIAQKGS